MKISHNKLYNKALSFLARRDYSYKELFAKLKSILLRSGEFTLGDDSSDSSCIIDEVLQELIRQGYLSERRYIENYIRSKSKKFASLKIEALLLTKTDDKEMVRNILREQGIDNYQNALHLWQKKFANSVMSLPKVHTAQNGYNVQYARCDMQKGIAKQIRFLQNKGFAADVIRRVIKAVTDEGFRG